MDNAVQEFGISGATIEEVDIEFPVSHSELTEFWMRQIGVFYAEMAQNFADLLHDVVCNGLTRVRREKRG